MVFFGVVILAFLLVLIIYWYTKNGALFFANYSRIGTIIWLLGLGLYDLQLTELYKPSISINIIGLLIAFNFLILASILPDDIERVYDCCHSIKLLDKASFKFPVYIAILLGIFSFAVNLQQGKLRFFSANKGIGNEISFSYFLNLMVPVSLIFYIYFRNETIKRKKILYLIMMFFSLFLIFTNMSRGPIQFWIFGVLIYEIGNYCVRKNKKWFSTKQLIVIFAVVVVGVWGFGIIGDIRTKNFFLGGANAHYLMKKDYPVGFTWLYIYISSPLENARYMLQSEVPKALTFGNNLFYPIIKAIAGIIGQGDSYSDWMSTHNTIYPYLKNIYGLNVSSFIADAYNDFNIFGIFIYLLFYDVIAILVHKILNNKSITKFARLIMVVFMLQIPLWSIFDDSVFRIIIVWIDMFFVFLVQWLGRKFIIKIKGKVL